MELIRVTKDSFENKRVGESTISFSKRGYIGISQRAALKLKLKENDEIYFNYDKNNTKDWYLAKNDPNSKNKVEMRVCFRLRSTRASKSLIFNSKNLVMKIFDLMEDKIPDGKECIKFPLAVSPTVVHGEVMFAIITKGMKIYNSKDAKN